ncbi:hypothetical protein VNN32_02025 [Lactococcus petauri]|uniref:hypothetical protein n=1 Tax=Lactococcus petauri TaxID=1940789 RepID=UPI0030D33F90
MKKSTKIKTIFYVVITLFFLLAGVYFVLFIQNKVSQYPYLIFIISGITTRGLLIHYEVKSRDRFVPPLVLSDLEEKLSKSYFVSVMSAIALVFVFVFGRNTYFANTYCLVFIVFLIFAIANIFSIKKNIKKLKIKDK